MSKMFHEALHSDDNSYKEMLVNMVKNSIQPALAEINEFKKMCTADISEKITMLSRLFSLQDGKFLL